MTFALSPRITDASWRQTGCGERCRSFVVRFPGRRYDEMIVVHDPQHHEAYGEYVLIRQFSPLIGSIVQTGALEINGYTGMATVQGVRVELTPTEMRLLFYFAKHLDRLISCEELLNIIWGSEFAVTTVSRHGRQRSPEAHLVRVNIARLRGKLGDERRLLITERGRGYRLLNEMAS